MLFMTNNDKIILRFKVLYGILGISKMDFAEMLKMPFQNVNRLMLNSETIISKGQIICNLGFSMDWLITGKGKVTLDTPDGLKLNRICDALTEDGYLKSYLIKTRTITWINFIYQDIDKFYKEYPIDELLEFVNEDYEFNYDYNIPNSIYLALEDAGCNLNWLLNNNNTTLPFNQNEKGMKLKDYYTKNKIGRSLLSKLQQGKYYEENQN